MTSTSAELLANLRGTWLIDSDRCELAFAARHMQLSTVRGTVNAISGQIVVGDTLEGSWVFAVVDLRSTTTRWKLRDKAIHSAKLLDVNSHETASYRSTAVRPDTSGDGFVVAGDLTFMDVTRPVSLSVQVTSAYGDASRPVFTARTELVRADFDFRLHEGPAFLDRAIAPVIPITIRIEPVAS